MRTTIIGIDCSTDYKKKVGLALGYFDRHKTTIQQVQVGPTRQCVVETLANWIRDLSPVLLALDAPLGWPARLGQILTIHQAGQPIVEKADDIFYRETDRVVRDKIPKRPLYVSADKIAHTALEALRLLKDLSDKTTGEVIPLAPDSEVLKCTSAIEVYPAATLKAYALPDTGYKGKGKRKKREEILKKLKEQDILRVNPDLLKKLQDNDNALDAAICVLSGADFLSGEVIKPKDMRIDPGLVKREGWIWVRYPKRKVSGA